MKRICIVCGKEFEGYVSSKLCSDACTRIRRNEIRGKHETGTKRSKTYDRKTYEPRACMYCGKIFTPIRVNQITCASAECTKARNRDMHRKKDKVEPATIYRDFTDPENYAVNQMAATLAKVPKIRIEL